MKALIATDGSDCSFAAIRQACRILSPERDEVVLYYSPPSGAATELDSETVERGQQGLSEAIFAAAMKEVPEAWRPAVQKMVGEGDPRTGIAQAAAKVNANLIVIGARGLGTISRMLLGSVSRSVVHTAKVPVLVARKNEAAATANTPKTDAKKTESVRILLACENLESGKQLAAVVGQVAWPAGSSCEAMTVVPSVLGGAVPEWMAARERSAEVQQLISAWVDEEQTQLATAKKDMEAVCQTVSPAFHSCTTRVAQGHAATEIVETATKQHVSLIVVGSKASSALGRLLVGSTCETVLNRATCSVLVVPVKE